MCVGALNHRLLWSVFHRRDSHRHGPRDPRDRQRDPVRPSEQHQSQVGSAYGRSLFIVAEAGATPHTHRDHASRGQTGPHGRSPLSSGDRSSLGNLNIRRNRPVGFPSLGIVLSHKKCLAIVVICDLHRKS